MNPRNNDPVRNPRQFVSSVFDLAYGVRDGSEPLSSAEIKASLTEAGVNLDAAWADARRILEQAQGRRELAEARRGRSAAPELSAVAVIGDTKEALIAKIRQCINLLGPGSATVFARKWENCSVGDLTAIHRQIERQVARSHKHDSTGK